MNLFHTNIPYYRKRTKYLPLTWLRRMQYCFQYWILYAVIPYCLLDLNVVLFDSKQHQHLIFVTVTKRNYVTIYVILVVINY